MIEAFTLKSRGKDMVCLLEYKDPSVRGKKVVLYKHGFFGNKITPHRIMVNASHELQEEGYTICRFDCAGAGDSEGDSHYTTILRRDRRYKSSTSLDQREYQAREIYDIRLQYGWYCYICTV